MGKHDGCFGCGCHQIYLKFDNMRRAHRWRSCGRLSLRPPTRTWSLSLEHSSRCCLPAIPAHPSIKAADALFIYTVHGGFNLLLGYGVKLCLILMPTHSSGTKFLQFKLTAAAIKLNVLNFEIYLHVSTAPAPNLNLN